MSTLALAARDSRTMLRRSLRHLVRYPSLTLFVVGIPIVFLLLFVYVFGGTLGAGLGGSGGRAQYANYLAPALLVMTVAGAAQAVAISVATDMTEGIINRFRTMAISRASVLTGHVVCCILQALGTTTLVLAVTLLVGFRPTAGLPEWIGVIGVVTMVALALSWLCVALGLAAKSVATASNTPQLLIFLPFIGSGFVPTDSMPTGLRWFAEYQPFTPIIETLRGLLLGTPIGNSATLAIGWSAAIALLGYLWSRRLFNRVGAR